MSCFRRAEGSVRLFVSLPSDNNDDRLLSMLTGGRQTDGLGHGVVHRGTAVGRDATNGATQKLTIGRPSLQQHWPVAEAIQEDLILRVEDVVEKAVERALRGADLLARHAAAGIEDDPEAHRHALGTEVCHRLWLVIFVDGEVLLLQARDEPAVRIGHARGDVDQLDAALEVELGSGFWGVGCWACNETVTSAFAGSAAWRLDDRVTFVGVAGRPREATVTRHSIASIFTGFADTCREKLSVP